MTAATLGLILAAMANKAGERAEYFTARASHNPDSGAKVAEAVSWTLRAILLSGAEACVKIAKEEERERG